MKTNKKIDHFETEPKEMLKLSLNLGTCKK